MKWIAAAALWAIGSAYAAIETITPFSLSEPGSHIPPGWRTLVLPDHKAPSFTLETDAGKTVMHLRSDAAVGSLAHMLDADPVRTPMLAWRWKVDRVLDKGRFGTKEGDDFAARVYVSFDIPMETLSIGARVKMKLAKFIYGADLPAAAICYVWDNKVAPGTHAFNPYSDRIRMVVLQSGAARVGEWVAERRDVDADFREAFGSEWKHATPHITGVAISADTDQTLESVNAWFGDLRLEARPMKRLVLVGGGHAHIEVLRQVAMRPEAGVHVTLVTPRPWLIYTGMLPGHIAGHYAFNECTIDLAALARQSRVDFVQSSASLVSPDANEVVCADGTVLGYEFLSLDVGSKPLVGSARGVEANAVLARPLERVIEGWMAVYSRTAQEEVDSITVVGGGAGGIEIALAMNYRLRSTLDPPHPKVRLISDVGGAGVNAGAYRRLRRIMRRAGVDYHVGSPVAEVGRGYVRLASGNEFATEATFWMTGSSAHDWIRDSGLATDPSGYLLTNSFLQSVSHGNVFGAGDCATMQGEPRPKAGVFAVHAAPALAANLLAAAEGKPMLPHRPQRNYLSLISAGEQRAVGAWNSFSWQGKWAWRWKDRIDRRFMELYRTGQLVR